MVTATMILKLATRFVLLVLAHLITVPTYVVWMLLLRPLRLHPATRALYWQVDTLLMKGVHVVVAYWIYASGYIIVEAGDDISECVGERTVVLANHQSTADVPALMVVLGHQDRGLLAGRLCWVMEYVFKFTQFGLLCRLHGDFFIVQGRETRHLQPKLLEAHLKNVFLPRGRQWVVLFPEGGFLRKRREASQKFARKNGFPVLEHVTLPRLGALESILNTLGQQQNGESSSSDNGSYLKWLIDITIIYPEGKPLDLPRMFFGLNKPCQTLVHFKKYLVSEIPKEHEALTQWLYKRYEEKDRMLGEFYTKGELRNGPSQRQRPLIYSHAYAWLILAAFFISTVFHICVLQNLVSYTCSVSRYFFSA